MHPLMRAMEAAGRAALEAELAAAQDALAGTCVTRRAVLAAGASAGLVIAIGALPRAAQATTGPLEPNQFVRVGTDNLVTIVCKHLEMGQGSATGLAVLAAEELDADWSLVRTEHAPASVRLYANLNFGVLQSTGDSSSIANSWLQYRAAGATARAMLVAAAAEAWGVPASEISTQRSVLSHASGRRASYGEMAAAAARRPLPLEPALKTAERFTLIGKERDAVPRVDSPSKCDGSAIYTSDLKLPGLLSAVIAWPPSFGARLVSFDATHARAVAGVTDVVEVPEGVAVVATGTWAALQARAALEIAWDESAGRGLDTETLFAQYRAKLAQRGEVFVGPSFAAGKPAAAKTVEAVYEFPFLAHASMEPLNCIAWLHDGRLETWAGHQFPTCDHVLAAEAAGLPLWRVELHTLISGGSFGRRASTCSDFVVAAVHVAKAIGRPVPVRLQYLREDDMCAGFYRPMVLHAVEAGLDAAGRVTRWEHGIVGQSVVVGALAAPLVGVLVDPTSVEGVHPSCYELPMMRGRLHATTLPVRPLWWRSVGNSHTAYVMETMVDQLAHAAGRDPLAFRLALLQRNPRAAAVLELVARAAGWGRAMPAGSAQGLALHACFGTTVAQVAEVSLDGGTLRVDRVVCAVDCGVAVNPDIVRAQMEGGIGFALGALLHGEIALRDGRVQQRNFDGYRALRIYEMPAVEVHIVPSTAAPTGVGEPGVPPLGPAVANALVRLGLPLVRRLPFARAGLVRT